MTEERAKRKLSGILSADAVGYSRLMHEDEASTIRNLEDSKELMSELIEQFKGRVVDAPGDNLLAEFSSVVDATECAVQIQRELKSKNAEIPDNRRMDFRIGVNLGDVVEEANRIYGDGVNIAARIEGLAEPGGICIAGIVFGQVKNKLKLGYEYLGEHSIKNIAEPVRVYKLLMEPEYGGKVIGEEEPKTKQWRRAVLMSAVVIVFGAIAIWNFYFRTPPIEPASVEKMAFPLPDKPSIAVLPFDNLSGDPEQDYIADGFSENITTALSYLPQMFVIARNSSFTYKGKPVKVRQVSEELGVRYILEGSVIKSGEKIRITAQLIDALTGGHIWSERYDRDFSDFLSLLDEITLAITVELQVELTEGEKARPVTTDNFDAWRYVEKGKQFMFTSGDTKKAREFYEKALEIDPEYAGALTAIAWTHLWDARYGKSHSRGESFKRAVELAKKSVAMDDNQPSVHGLFIFIYLYQKQYDKAIEEGRKAIALDPNNSDLRIWFGEALYRSGNFEEAVKMCEEAMRLHPYAPLSYFGQMMNAYYWVERYEESLSTAEQLIDLGKARNPKIVWWGYWGTARAKVRLGRVSEAQEDVNKLLELRPEYCLELDRRNTLYKPEIIAKEHEDMRKAGLPEHPPLKLPDKPSIAVLAFDNLSGDPEQEYFSDGIAENIITALSKVGELFVIARNSSFTYKGKPVKVQQISRELGVRYVLEGSVQKSGDRVRINAQLIDAKNEQHLWAEKYDRGFKDIFEIQDDITVKIVNALRIKLTEGEQVRIAKSTKNPDVFLKTLELNSLWKDGTEESLMRFGQLVQEVIDLEPESPLGYTQLAWYHKGLADRGISSQENIKKAFMLAQKALSMDESDSFAHTLLGSIYVLMRKYEKAIASGKRSVELQPNGANAHAVLGSTLNYAGQADEAIAHLKQAIRLNPFPPYYIYYALGLSYNQKGQYEDALKEFKKALKLAPNAVWIHVPLSVTYILAGREDEARASALKALEFDPKSSVKRTAKMLKFKNQAHSKQILDAMRKAGFPE